MKSFYVGIKGVFQQSGRVLILERKDSKGSTFWDMPGGRINDEEDISQALHRELKEELGVEEVKIGDIITAFRLLGYDKDNNGLVILYYHASKDNLQITLSDEHTGYKWVNREELLQMLEDGEMINEGIQRAVSLAAE